MPFYNPNGELDANRHPRTYREEAAMARSAIDCVLNGEKAIYASSELTTGPRLYRLLRENGLKDARTLRREIGEERYLAELWHPNVAEANAFARELRERIPGRPLVITPAPYLAPGWSQAEYLAFWESLIRTRFKAVYFSDDWELSSGCSFELTVAVDAGLATFDARGLPLGAAKGSELIGRTADQLELEGFDVSDLRLHLDRLTGLLARDLRPS
ncbi:MAG: hypothetical protein HC897_18520 [Thermoanaerobaculia bacterium]|nr:hypothetical protein [Thermoanaerobaculia bacterium]